MRGGLAAAVHALLLGATLNAAAIEPGDVANQVRREGRYPTDLDISGDPADPGFAPPTGGGPVPPASGDPWQEGAQGVGDDGWQHDGWGDDPRQRGAGSGAAPAASTGPRRSTLGPLPGLLGGLGVVASYGLLVGVLVILIVAVAWLLARSLKHAAGATAAGGESPAGGPSDLAQAARLALDLDPDALMREGRVGEAIELLLLQALGRVGWEPSRDTCLTARDVLGTLERGDPRRLPLGTIVRHAEAVRFGGSPPTGERYGDMKRAYGELPAARAAERTT